MNSQQRRNCFLKGCILPFILLILIYIVWLFWNWRMTFYIQEIDMYIRIERIPFNDVKMSFSKNKIFGNDYVKYKNSSDIVWMEIYYVPPYTIYILGASEIKQEYYHIIEYKKQQKYRKRVITSNAWVPEYYDEYSDSTFLKNPSYHFSIYDYFSGFSLEDPNGKTIYKAGTER